jgi:crossover junction endodeoxyribonuclease RuvC
MTAPRLFCGIDPGLGGAVGFVSERGTFADVADLPTLTTTTGRRQIDFGALAVLLDAMRPDFVLLERVGPRPGEGSVGAFGFGVSYGGILATLASLRLAHDVIQPASWKRRAGIPPGAAKVVSIATAKRLLPDAAPHLSRVKDDGRAEALLLALQAWQTRCTTTHPRKEMK